MKNVIVVFGGDSVEHDISVLTGLHAARNVLDDRKVVLVYLTRSGQMVTSGSMGILSRVDSYIKGGAEKAAKCYFSGGFLCRERRFFGAKKFKVDAVLNCCHGGAGENGQLAAMLDMAGVAVTGCGYISAADLQSKSRTREILSANGYIQPQYTVIKKGGDVPDDIEFPVIVKPDTLGSSIGISVAHNKEEFAEALRLAHSLDETAIAERFLEDFTEVNCAAFRSGDKIFVSKCEVVGKKGAMFDFDAKYLEAPLFIEKKGGGDGEEPYERQDEVQDITRRAYEIFGCRGVVRADFLVSGGEIYLNEINTVPGFLAYHLWQKSGIPYGVLIEMLVEQAENDAEKGQKTVFNSEILQKNRKLVE